MKYLRLPLIALICTILIQLAMPYPVFADNATPPAPEVTGEVQPVETEQPAVEVFTATEQPALEVAPTEQAVEAIPTEDAPLTGADTMEGNQSDGILEALADTDLVVLDENNQPIPLAAEAAADAIANSDPAWCPDGTSPTTSGCTNYATFTALVNGLQSLGSFTNGTVYVQEGQYAGPETWITLDGNSLTNVGNLTLIGGWDLTAATPSQIGTTVFSAPVSIINWTHDVSVQDIEVDGSIWNGLTIDTAGNVFLENVTTNDNVHDGIRIDAGNSIVLNNIQANYNGDDGIDISSDTNLGSIWLQKIQTNHNGDDGIHIYSKQKDGIRLVDVISNYNGGDGLDMSGPLEAAVSCPNNETQIPGDSIIYDADGYSFMLDGPGLAVARICYWRNWSEDNVWYGQDMSFQNDEFNYNGENGMEIANTSAHVWIGGLADVIVDGVSVDQIPADTVYMVGNGQSGVWFNFFEATPLTTLEQVQARAEELYGSTAIAYLFRTSYGSSTLLEMPSFISSGNGSNDYYHVDVPSSFTCGWSVFEGQNRWRCIAPPAPYQLIGGEEIFVGGGEPNNDDAYPGDGTGNPGIPPSGGGDDSEGSSSGEGNTSLCAQDSINILYLPSGNNLTVYCPISGTLSVKEQTRKKLPTPLPDGLDFISGIEVTFSQDGLPMQIIDDSGHLKPSFVMPPDQAGKNLVILFWDASSSKWVELPAFGSEDSISLPNGGTVSEGVQILNNIGQIEVGVNFPGIFVLAVKE
jgi:hypothetical protein